MLDDYTHVDLYELETSTMILITKRAIHDYQTAKATVLQQLTTPTSAKHKHQLWKLLIHMDQLLLHFMPDPKQSKREEDRSTEQKVRERLALFWAGHWPLLITEAQASPRAAAGMWTEDRLAQRVQDLTDAGEIGSDHVIDGPRHLRIRTRPHR
jgi:hypothetical protein